MVISCSWRRRYHDDATGSYHRTCFWYILTSNFTLYSSILGIYSPRNLFRAPKTCMLGVSAFYNRACPLHVDVMDKTSSPSNLVWFQKLRPKLSGFLRAVAIPVDAKLATRPTVLAWWSMEGTRWKTLPRRPGHLNRRSGMYCSIDVSLTIPGMLVRTGHSTCKYSFLHPIHSNSRPRYFADVWCQDKQHRRSHASTVAYRFSLYSELHLQIFFFPSASLGILQLSLLLSFVFSFLSLDCVLMMAHTPAVLKAWG